jgi:hypothetical protein
VLFRYPAWHFSSVNAREGCVILELDMVQSGNGPASDSFAEADLLDWVNAMHLQSMFTTQAASGIPMFVKVSI